MNRIAVGLLYFCNLGNCGNLNILLVFNVK